MTHNQKVKQDYSDYLVLCRLSGINPQPKGIDWYPLFNQMKKNLQNND